MTATLDLAPGTVYVTDVPLEFPSGAVEVLPPGAPREQWLAERRRSIGGSDASTLVKLNPYDSLMALYLDKSGRLPAKPVTSKMEWGVRLEPAVREWFAETYELVIAQVGMLRRLDAPRVHINLDGAVVDADGRPVAAIEIKTTNWRQAYQWDNGQCPDHAELQAQLVLWTTGLTVCYVIGLIDGSDPQVRMVHANPDLGQMLADEAADFYANYVEPDQAPALDDSSATNDAIRRTLAVADDATVVTPTPALLDLIDQYLGAQAAVDSAKAQLREADSALRLEMGDAAALVDDPTKPTDKTPARGGRVTYLTLVNNGTFASTKFIEAEPELAAELTHDAPTLDVAELKAKHPAKYRVHCARTLRTRSKPLTALLAEFRGPRPAPTSEPTTTEESA
jgi:putative phage-type endonuclease